MTNTPWHKRTRRILARQMLDDLRFEFSQLKHLSVDADYARTLRDCEYRLDDNNTQISCTTTK